MTQSDKALRFQELHRRAGAFLIPNPYVDRLRPSVDRMFSEGYASDMNLEGIRQRTSGGGFRPFALRTSDGREYTVRHPEMVLIAPRSLAVVDRDGEIVTMDALHIVSIKNLRAKTNGTSKR